MSKSDQMLPSLAVNDIGNGRRTDIVLLGKGCHGDAALSVTAPYLNNLFVGEFRMWMRFAALLPILGNFVCHVVSTRTKKEMGWIAARRIVARVANDKAIWNWAKCQFVGKAVRNGSLSATTDMDISVAEVARTALPLPTIVGAEYLHLRPEAIFYREKAGIVSVDKPKWFALDMAASVFVSLGNRGLLTATAVAITVGNVVRGMILHVNSPFSTLTTPQDDSTHRCGNSLPASIIPQEAGL